MAVSRDKKTGKWVARRRVQLPGGFSRRIYLSPEKNTKAAAQQAEALAVAHLRRGCEWLIDCDRNGVAQLTEVAIDQMKKRAVKAAQRGDRNFDPEPVELQVPKVVPTLADFFGRFIAVYAKTNNKPSEVHSKESILRNHLGPALGHLPLNQVTAAVVHEFIAGKLDEGLSRKTVNNIIAVLSKGLHVGVQWEVIDRVPCFEWLKAPMPETRFLSFHEANRLIEAAAKVDAWHCSIVLGLKTGMRLGELRGLRWKDVDLDNRRVVVRRSMWRDTTTSPKNHRSRVIALAPSAARALAVHPRNDGGLVFGDDKGHALSVGKWRHGLYRASRLAHLKRVEWHCLRHTFASHLVMKGATMKAVQELLGHATMTMTMRYAHLSPASKVETVGLLDEPGSHRAETPTLKSPEEEND